MKKLFIIIMMLVPGMSFAAGGSSVDLDYVEVSLKDKVSLQNGAKLFVNYCLSCHSAQYMRYNRMAADLDIPEELVKEEMIFTGGKIGDPMTTTMSEEDGKQWFGVAPPDLTLVARARGVDWLYTYLRTFYADDSRPYGVNNLVFPDVGMPHVLLELQGLQECVMGPSQAANGGVRRDPLTGKDILDEPCGQFAINEPGLMSPEEYDKAMYDLVNFLAYVGEPAARDRYRIGIYVLLFIAFFFVFTWLLNREYWKDVH